MKSVFLIFIVCSLSFASENWMLSLSGVNPPNKSGLESFDFSPITNSKGSDVEETSNYSFNLYRKVSSHLLIGLIFKQYSKEFNKLIKQEYLTVGASVIHQSNANFLESYYAELQFLFTSNSENKTVSNSSSSKEKTYLLKFGKRFYIGEIWGLKGSYAPEFIYSLTTQNFKHSGFASIRRNSFSIELIKFDIFF